MRRPRNAPAAVRFRPLARADLARLHAWLNEPEVARWYSHDRAPTRRQVERKYGPRIDGASPTRVFVVTIDGDDAGIAQSYRLADYPALADALGAPAHWAGLDYFLGEPRFRGRRLAHRVLDAFVLEVVFAMPGIRAGAALPARDNVKSIRALARAGFVCRREVELAEGDVDCLMLREARAEP